MSALWQALKNALHCKSRPSDVHEPKPRSQSQSPSRVRSSCGKPKSARSSSNCKSGPKDVINHESKRFQKNQTIASPLSIRSNDLINPVIHQVRFSNSEFNIAKYQNDLEVGSPSSRLSNFFSSGTDPFSRTTSGSRLKLSPGPLTHRRFVSVDNGVGGFIRPGSCRKCGEPLTRHDAEDHYLSKHAVSEVLEEDSSRKVIEMIVKAGWTNHLNKVHIERILKVNNPQTKLAIFEEYRETVKIRAHRLLQHSKKHPHCLADGNELLRFYGTTLSCSLGGNRSSTLCTFQRCNVCCIIRHGFSSKRETNNSLGIYTTSTSERAYRSIETVNDERQYYNRTLKKALIVCRVVAGRVHKPMGGNSQELSRGGRSMFDSLAGEIGVDSHFEELYLLNPIALLPCFVIVCK